MVWMRRFCNRASYMTTIATTSPLLLTLLISAKRRNCWIAAVITPKTEWCLFRMSLLNEPQKTQP